MDSKDSDKGLFGFLSPVRAPLGRRKRPQLSCNRNRSCRYDVFISFRGTDTSKTFVDHLYAHLIRKGIFAFKDDIELRKGEFISPQLVQAIQDSRVSIVVFSEDYASSSWCLDEMAAIADCHQKFKQTVFLVFYHMDPSHVRKQSGVYENAFVSHNKKFKQDPGKVDRWKTSMTNLGNLNGWHVKDDKPEFGEIEKIVQEVIKALGHKFSGIADDLIGIQPRVEELEKLLKLSSTNDDFRVLGIWGMRGIGKTTHATVLYDKISYGFDACCFIENVSRIYRDGGAIAVRKQILHQTLGGINLEDCRSFEMSGIVRHGLRNLKVLIVLDNVDQFEQLRSLEIYPKLLHTGSRMIITTRDEHILRAYKADEIHEVSLMIKNDDHELFCKRAFESEDQSSKDNGLCGCLSPVWALLDCRKVKRPQLSSNPSPLGQGSPTCSSMDSNLNQSSGPALDLSPLGQGGPSSSSMDSNINQTIGPSSYLSLLGQEGTASSSSNSIQSCRYDVFISFRGIDTRNTFVDHLYDHLIRKGIFAFKDDERLQKGELISPQLVQAIKDSRISVVVFSRDYASSSWCLDEMATIVECHQQLNQTVIPVFYDVDPSHVRKQNGVYENAFVLHDEKFQQDPSKVVGWKSAMKNLGNLVGFDVRNRPESTMIQKIVQGVIKKLNLKFSWFTEDLIGIQPRVEELEKLLKLSSANDDFRVLGIWGMGGIGKTTHATVLYDKISYGFDACCFIENVSRIYRDGGAIAVQKQILHQTLGEINLEAYRSFEISGIVRHRLRNLKVLIVLDNVDQLEQLQQLEIDPKLLHTGGRMIITTRDEHILRVYKADEIHKVSLMNENDAHELFCKKAFESEEQSSKCMELISEVLKYAQCLPLAIKVLGSSLCTRDATQWEDVLDRLEKSPNKEIMDVLEISVEGLQYEDREIFLHIACFFKGEREEYVRRILDACALNPRIGIQNLVEKSLITIKNEEIHMHEMLQKLGEKIVRHKYPNEPES